MSTFRWIIYPSRAPELHAIADKFLVEGCRLRVGGNSIDVEADDEAKAYDLASRYLASLQKRLPILGRLISEVEYSAYPAEIIHVTGLTKAERSRVLDAVRAVRNEMLASSDAALVDATTTCKLLGTPYRRLWIPGLAPCLTFTR